LASGGYLDERDARREIARYCALLWQRRLVTGTSGNVSVRLRDGDIVVTPTQRSLGSLGESELVRTAPSGVPRDGQGTPTSELPLHIAAYAVRKDVCAIVHTHPTFCVVWSKTGRTFERDTVGARETLGEVAWTRYEPPGSQALADVTATEFARGVEIVLMERHGLSAVAASLEEAFVSTDLAEEAARIAFFSQFLPSR
jgi:ribulose-5-phosphate 4-epimerase/fuculose-1-phosphate aldolase